MIKKKVGLLALLVLFAIAWVSGCAKSNSEGTVTETQVVESEVTETESETNEIVEAETEESESVSSEIAQTTTEENRDNNSEIEDTTGNKTKVVACVGDSLTYGTVSVSNQVQTENPYPSVLASLLGDGYEVLNFGEPGAPLTGDELSYLYRESYEPSVEAAADMYIIMLGTNDANLRERFDAETFRSALKDLIDTYRNANAEAEIYLVTPPVLISDGGDEYDQFYLLTNFVIPIIEEVADEKGTGLIDVFSGTKDHKDWLQDDGVHFIDEGYIQIANMIYNGLQINN
ncbi:MAG: hypothetical protein K6F37_09545 [Lachnospiraceae bacterium]|nr:hypothetical protein [Lachnospiraceae bacterium]